MNYREESYLMHYGVPGMKWGQRRKVYSAAIKKASNLRKKYTAEYLKGQTTASKIIDYITYGSPNEAAMTYGELRAAAEIGNPGED